MLKSMRRKTITRNIIIGIIVALLASYVLFSFGQAPPKVQGDVIARFGSSPIKFRDALIQKENLRSRFSSLDAERVNQIAASSLITDAILIHGANEAKVMVSDEELRDYVVRLRQMLGGEEHYLTNEQWQDWIKYRFQLQVENFEEYLREKEILIQKYRSIMGDSTFFSEEAVKDEFITENTKLDMELLVLNPYMVQEKVSLKDDELRQYYDNHTDLFMSSELRQIRFVTVNKKDFQDSISPSDEEIAEYYEDNKDRSFKDPEKAKASHILLNLTSRTEDQAKKELDQIRQEIESGLEFSEAAKKYSEHQPTKEDGGSLSLTPKGQFVRQFGPEFDKAAFELELGQVSEPVKSRLGFHLIQVESRTAEQIKSLEDCREDIVNILKREKGMVQARTRASDFLAQQKLGKEFEAVAQEMEMTVHVSDFFDKHHQSNLGKVLGQNGRVRQKVFALENIDDVTEVLDAGSTFVVAQWMAEKEPEILSFENNKFRIRQTANKIRGENFILETMAEIKSKLESDASLTLRTVCADYDFINDNLVKQTGQFGADSIPQDLSVSEIDYDRDLFHLEKGAFLGPLGIRNDAQYLLGRVTEKVEADLEKLSDERQAIIARLRGTAEYERLSLYTEALRQELDPNQQITARVQATVSQF